VRRVAFLLPGALLLAACGRGDAVLIGSKAFTESVILAEIATRLAASEGVDVRHQGGLGGSAILFRGLETGEIDAYPEYTGTLTGELLAAEGLKTSEDLARSLSRRGIEITPTLGFQNTYALGMKRARAEALGIRRLSDLKAHPGLVLGFSSEFVERGDGWPMVKARYGLWDRSVTGLEHSLAYKAMADGQIDVTDLYTTDAEITWHDLLVLEDDLQAFPRYDAVFLYRADLAKRAPEVPRALLRLAGRIDEPRMVALNVRVKPGEGIRGEEEAEVASAFLAEAFGVASEVETGLFARVLLRTKEHVFLVAVSLLLAIVLGVPLGILAAKRPAVGQTLLAGVGVAQTIPALALLFFFLPVFGFGNLPAVFALVLYSLLPILRSTHAGLTTIEAPLRESAEVLGLSPRARLLRVELPLASPHVVAGVKTAAVLNVGFAMLGAFIGAGGYGQPILTGLRRYDMARVWEGVIPSMALAFAAYLLFEGVERLVVPRGLRKR
jgi:osmoprotectant transport system permease protein